MRFGVFAALVGVTGAMVASQHVNAEFWGLTIEHHATVNTPDGVRNVFRLYANFSEGGDMLLAWGGSAEHPTVFQTQACNTAVGTPYYNPPEGRDTAPSQFMINQNPFVEWDTFATIGVSKSNQGSTGSAPFDATQLSPGFPEFISGNQLTITNGMVFVTNMPPNHNQARADYANDGDPQLRVLMAQFTVAEDEGVVRTLIGEMVVQNAQGQVVTLFDQMTDMLAAYGRCCLATGGCVFTTQAFCGQSNPQNTFIGCDPCSTCPEPPSCHGDIAPAGGDGTVGVPDLLAVINGWGPCGDPCDADIAPKGGDGIVGVPDLLAVINSWGPCE